jgi:hypothetical protein
MAYNLGKIRELIGEALTSQELADLCFDAFPTVYKDFDGQNRGTNTRSLVDYAFKQGQIGKLLKEIEGKNPYCYNKYRNQIGAEIVDRPYHDHLDRIGTAIDRPEPPPVIVRAC